MFDFEEALWVSSRINYPHFDESERGCSLDADFVYFFPIKLAFAAHNCVCLA